MFDDRSDAGRQLVRELQAMDLHRPVVVAIPRGGVVVAREVARALRAPLDVIITRKLGTPLEPELAFGAISRGGVQLLDRSMIRMLGISDEEVREVIAIEERELQRRARRYRGTLDALGVEGRDVVLVDDGLATGMTVRAAVMALRQEDPNRVILAVPVASPEALRMVRGDVDDVVCLSVPEGFFAVGQWYRSFEPVDDDEIVRELREIAETPRTG